MPAVLQPSISGVVLNAGTSIEDDLDASPGGPTSTFEVNGSSFMNGCEVDPSNNAGITFSPSQFTYPSCNGTQLTGSFTATTPSSSAPDPEAKPVDDLGVTVTVKVTNCPSSGSKATSATPEFTLI